MEWGSVLGKEGLVFDGFLIESFLRIFVRLYGYERCNGMEEMEK